MAYTTIDDPSAHFQTVLYTGDGSTHSITNTGNSDLQPDLIWIKERSSTSSHALFDSTRGVNKVLASDTTAAEDTSNAELMTAFNSDGFTVDDNNRTNQDTITHVAWQWKANGGTTTSDTGGNLNTVYQVNSTSKFGILTYTGNESAGQSMNHGLGTTPAVFMIKNRSQADAWAVYHHKNTAAPATDKLVLNTTAATADVNTFTSDNAPNSTVIYVGAEHNVNANTETYVCYYWTEIQGYSKFGSYTGNANADGPFAYTGFKPAWVMIKRYDGDPSWIIFDNKRPGYNGTGHRVYADNNLGEDTGTEDSMDFLSNGFKVRGTSNSSNASGGNFIYMAFAEQPFVTSSGVPATAR